MVQAVDVSYLKEKLSHLGVTKRDLATLGWNESEVESFCKSFPVKQMIRVHSWRLEHGRNVLDVVKYSQDSSNIEEASLKDIFSAVEKTLLVISENHPEVITPNFEVSGIVEEEFEKKLSSLLETFNKDLTLASSKPLSKAAKKKEARRKREENERRQADEAKRKRDEAKAAFDALPEAEKIRILTEREESKKRVAEAKAERKRLAEEKRQREIADAKRIEEEKKALIANLSESLPEFFETYSETWKEFLENWKSEALNAISEAKESWYISRQQNWRYTNEYFEPIELERTFYEMLYCQEHYSLDENFDEWLEDYSLEDYSGFDINDILLNVFDEGEWTYGHEAAVYSNFVKSVGEFFEKAQEVSKEHFIKILLSMPKWLKEEGDFYSWTGGKRVEQAIEDFCFDFFDYDGDIACLHDIFGDLSGGCFANEKNIPKEFPEVLIAYEAKIVQLLSSFSNQIEAQRAKEYAKKAEIAAKVKASIRLRKEEPTRVNIHLGPTNSGKTYRALRELAARGKGIYACPLRMLAREAYFKLGDELGFDKVGLITGEESINPEAPIICCTAEMAPHSGTLLVLDEAQWAHDPDRGYAWTRLLVGGQYDEIEVTGSKGAEHFLRKVFKNVSEIKIDSYERLTDLAWKGSIDLSRIPSRSLLVAFSRKAILTLAKRLQAKGRKVGVLYGMLPPAVRQHQIDKFITGQVDILVVSDVVGHGINVPADNVVFAQTEKYDGHEHRDLHLWEAAQIAGRAGRFQLSDGGSVYTLMNEGPGFTPNTTLAKQAASAAAGKSSDRLIVKEGLVRPILSDLSELLPEELALGLEFWEREMLEVTKNHPEVKAMDTASIRARLGVIEEYFEQQDCEWQLSLEETWQFATLPIDTEKSEDTLLMVLNDFVSKVSDGCADAVEEFLSRIEANSSRFTLEGLEYICQFARDIMVAANSLELFKDLWKDAAKLEELSSNKIQEIIEASISEVEFGVCVNCGGKCAPWFQKCENCFNVGRRRYRSDYEDFDEDEWY